MGSLGRAIYTVGSWIRGTGQAIDRLGVTLQGSNYVPEQVSKHRTIMNVFQKEPMISKDAFVAPSAAVMGDVLIGRGSSVWYGVVLRGDVNSIRIGSGSNIQDNTLVHVAKFNLAGKVLPTIIGDNVTIVWFALIRQLNQTHLSEEASSKNYTFILNDQACTGHGAVLHACTVEDEAFVGMGAILLDGAVVEKNAMVGAGSLVRQGTRIPSGEVWAGNPAKFLRKLTEEEIASIKESASIYTNLAQVHSTENAKTFDEIELEKLLRKKFENRDEDYDSMIGVVREVPPELVLPQNILPENKSSSKAVSL